MADLMEYKCVKSEAKIDCMHANRHVSNEKQIPSFYDVIIDRFVAP